MNRSRIVVPLTLLAAAVVVGVAVRRSNRMQPELNRTTAEIAELRPGLEGVADRQAAERRSPPLAPFAAIPSGAAATPIAGPVGENDEGFCYVSRPGQELPALPPRAV